MTLGNELNRAVVKSDESAAEAAQPLNFDWLEDTRTNSRRPAMTWSTPGATRSN